jgi:hypothetical protein
VEELEQALSFPWERWIVFLHPSQPETVNRSFKGPARVTGSAGTGKTVVALHRAVRMAAQGPHARVLLTTFSDPLASALERRLKILVGDNGIVVPRLGRKSRMGHKQRDRLWPIFQRVQRQIADRGLVTEAGVFLAVTVHYKTMAGKPFTSIVVDEAQDLGVPELRFVSSIPASPQNCEQGWSIQNRAKPQLIPLVEGRQIIFGEDSRTAIATWATMATITGEYTLQNAVQQSDRKALMHTLMPIPGWRIWIGTYRRVQRNAQYGHACMPIMMPGEMVIPNVLERGVPLTNTQWTTVMIGDLYIHTASSSYSPDYIRD